MNLNSVVKNKAFLFSKVRVADIVLPATYTEEEYPDQSYWDIASRHFDFVICSKFDYLPMCVIELNDSSHDDEKVKQGDKLKRWACEDSNINFLSVKCSRTYRPNSIRTILNDARIQAKERYLKSLQKEDQLCLF